MKLNRRTILQTAGSGIVGMAGIGGVAAGTATAEEVTIKGQLIKHNGDPVPFGQIDIMYPDEGAQDWIADDGSFEVSIGSSDAEYSLGYNKYREPWHKLEPVKNGAPHVDLFDAFYVNGDKNLGEVQLPEPYMVDVRVLDENGEPLELDELDMIIRAWHKGDAVGRGGTYPTDSKGYVYIPEADFTGFELAGAMTLVVTVPRESGGSVEFEKDLLVENSMTMTVQLEEGVTVSESDESTRTPSIDTGSSTETPTAADTPTESPTPTATVTDTPTESPMVAETSTQEAQSQDAISEPESSRQRGFFSNKGDEPSVLSNVFNLTMLGFLLSIVGIIHQLLEGR